ncbi:MAG: hypothetical protein A2X51_02620 [Candidatus Rokubacteria bacterium GWC2_70_24]|nr:MAG: hypothetical protein A2X51_02620 [Candidatus Rokubacteria bacterium GWC2_70_24]
MKRADVKLETGEAKVIYDDSKQTPEKLAAAVDKLGFQASVTGVAAAPRPTLYVDGLKDLKTVQKVERTLTAVPGVKGVTVVPKDGEVFVTHEAGVSARDLVAALAAAGVTARVATP